MPPRKPSDGPDLRSFLRSDFGLRARTAAEHAAMRSGPGDPLAEVRDIRLPPEGVRTLGLPAQSDETPPLAPVDEKLGWFELTIVDERGTPLDGLDLELAYQATRKTVRTAPNGRVRVEDVTASFATARFVDVPALREKLSARKVATVDEDLAKAPGVQVQQVRDAIPAVQLDAGRPLTLMLVREHVRLRLVGMFFETDKAFLLPSAMHGIRGIVQVYDANPHGKLLAVGHTDTAGEEKWNLDLSLERADAVADYLTDNVDGWLKWFDTALHPKKVWGLREEQHILSALPSDAEPFYTGKVDGFDGPQTATATTKFQAWSNATRGTALVVDGKLGPATRREIVAAYMEIDGTSLPKGIELKRHGCGELFPEEETGDGVSDQENRRVEVFCFDGEIEPPPPGKLSHRGSTEYPEWRKRVSKTIDFTTDLDEVFIRVLDRKHKPMKKTPFRVTWSPTGSAFGVSDDDGLCGALMPRAVVTFIVEWGTSQEKGSQFAFRREARRIEGDSDEAIHKRLDNLGFEDSGDAPGQVRDYQRRRGLSQTGRMGDVRDEVVSWHDRGVDKPVTQD